MNTKLHAVADAKVRPIGFFMSAGQFSDYTGAAALLGSLPKATARLRRDGRTAARFSLTVTFLAGGRWSRGVTLFPSQDTAVFLRLHRALWVRLWRGGRPGAVISVHVQLGDVVLIDQRQGDLLAPLAPAERTQGERVSAAVDHINARFGDSFIRYGINAPHPGFFERG